MDGAALKTKGLYASSARFWLSAPDVSFRTSAGSGGTTFKRCVQARLCISRTVPKTRVRVKINISKTDRLLWRCGGRLIPLDRLPCCGDTLGVWDSGTLGNCALTARKLPVRGNFDLKVGNSFRLTLAKSLLFSTTSSLSSSWFVGVYLVDRFLNLVVCL